MLFINYRTQRRRALPCPFAVSAGVGPPTIPSAGPDKPPSGGRQGHFCRQLPGAVPAVQYGRQRAAARYFVQASVSWFMPSLVCFQHTTARCGTPYRISPFRKNLILLSGKFYPLASLWYNKAAILRQHRTIPALRLKHRFGGCGTASAAPRSPYRHLELCGIALKFLLPSFQRRNKNPRKLIPPSKSSR